MYSKRKSALWAYLLGRTFFAHDAVNRGGGGGAGSIEMHRPLHVTQDDVIKWKHFSRYWPFVRGIHRSPVIPHTKASDAELWCFLWMNALNERLSKQSWGWWLQTPSGTLLRHCNKNRRPLLVTMMFAGVLVLNRYHSITRHDTDSSAIWDNKSDLLVILHNSYISCCVHWMNKMFERPRRSANRAR